MTGPNNTYVYMKAKQEQGAKETVFTQEHSQINSLEQGRSFSQNFTCHAWSRSTGRILVCTDNGEMLLCDPNGEYKAFILELSLIHI